MPFDAIAAKQAGYTDAEIQQYLASQPQSVTIPSGPMQTGQIIPTTQPQQLPELPQGLSLGNVIEPALTMGSGMVAEPLAGLAGIASLPFGAEQAAQNVESVRGALTIPPLSQEGEQGLQAVGGALQPVGSALQALEQGAGEFGFEHGGPIGGAIAQALPTAGLMALGAAPVRSGVKSLVKGGAKAADKTVKRLLGEAAPTADNLKAAARGIYDDLGSSGVVVGSNRVNNLGNEIAKAMKREGIDPTLHPDSSAALRRITAAQEANLSLTEIDTLRKLTKDAASNITKPADARLGAMMTEKIDDFLDGLSQKDFISGKGSDVGAKFKDARQLWQRAKKSELLDEAVDVAQDAASGYENGIRVEFRKLVKNKKKMRGFTPDEKEAIRVVTQGTTAANMAKKLGKLGFGEQQQTNALMSSAGIAGGAGAGSFLGPGGAAVGAVAVPLIGTVSAKLATQLTKNNARMAAAVVRAGKDGKKVVEAYIKSVPAKQRDVAELTELLMRPDVSLKGLVKNIPKPTAAQKISADAVFFADFMRSQAEQVETDGQ